MSLLLGKKDFGPFTVDSVPKRAVHQGMKLVEKSLANDLPAWDSGNGCRAGLGEKLHLTLAIKALWFSDSPPDWAAWNHRRT